MFHFRWLQNEVGYIKGESVVIYPREKAAEHLSQEGTIPTGRHDYIIFQPFIPNLD
jgi:hypothetical protein